MKKLLLLSALFAVFACSAFSQVTRRVLVEEFTNTGCPPCALTDPIVENFESGYLDKVCFLKYHVSWPDATDPFYQDQKTLDEANSRGQKYYGVTGVPYLRFGGTTEQYPSSEGVMEGVTDDIQGLMSPFTIDVTQSIEGDSIIANITVKAVDAVPSGDLRLVTAFAERFNPFQGSNGRPYHTSIVRKVVPGYDKSTGAPLATADHPAFTIGASETKTFRYAAKIGTTWTRSMLMAVVFIQDVDSKEVYQANWTVPPVAINADGVGTFTVVPTALAPELTLTNKSATAQNVKIDFSSADKPANWNFEIVGASGGVVALEPNETKTVTVNISTGTEAVGSAGGAFLVSSAEGIGIGGAASTFFGDNNTSVIVDAGAGTGNLASVAQMMQAKDMKIGIAPRVAFSDYYFDGWSKFKTVVWACGNSTGLYSNTGDWEKLETHLSEGGNFMITSTVTVGAYFNSGDESLMDWWRNLFHIEPLGYKSGAANAWSSLTGKAGDPIGDGIAATIPVKLNYRQPLKPSDGEFRSVFISEKKDTVASRALSGNGGKVVYLGFGLESLAQADRDLIGGRIIDWFNGAASVKTGDVATTVSVTSYPNPVSKLATFSFSITEPTVVNLAVYDVMGREVARVISNQSHATGTYEADLDVSKLTSGSYTYVLSAGAEKLTGTMLVQK